jgi:hypothetical protein
MEPEVIDGEEDPKDTPPVEPEIPGEKPKEGEPFSEPTPDIKPF